MEYFDLPKGGGFMRTRWGVPDNLKIAWADVRERSEKDDSKMSKFWKKGGKFAPGLETPEAYACMLLGFLSDWINTSGQEFSVRAERDGLSVNFGVALGRTPYFFKDREVTLNVRGKTCRIFHAVEAHERLLSDGRVTQVKAHYRGLRHFMWKGEKIVITQPDMAPTLTWSAEAQEVQAKFKGKDMMTMGRAARFVREVTESVGPG